MRAPSGTVTFLVTDAEGSTRSADVAHGLANEIADTRMLERPRGKRGARIEVDRHLLGRRKRLANAPEVRA